MAPFLPGLFAKHMCRVSDQEQPEAKATKSWFIFILSLLTYARFQKAKLRLFLHKKLLSCKSFQLAYRPCTLILPCVKVKRRLYFVYVWFPPSWHTGRISLTTFWHELEDPVMKTFCMETDRKWPEQIGARGTWKPCGSCEAIRTPVVQDASWKPFRISASNVLFPQKCPMSDSVMKLHRCEDEIV